MLSETFYKQALTDTFAMIELLDKVNIFLHQLGAQHHNYRVELYSIDFIKLAFGHWRADVMYKLL